MPPFTANKNGRRHLTITYILYLDSYFTNRLNTSQCATIMRKCGLTECTLSINEIYSVFKYNKSRPNCPCTHTPPPTRTHLPNIRRNSCALRKLDTVFVFSYHTFAHMPLTNFVRPNACHWLKMCCYVCVSVSLYTSIEAGENERIMSDVCLFFSIFSRYSVPPRSVRDAVCVLCVLCLP